MLSSQNKSQEVKTNHPGSQLEVCVLAVNICLEANVLVDQQFVPMQSQNNLITGAHGRMPIDCKLSEPRWTGIYGD